MVVSRWATLGILAISGALLVPQFAALGALLAVGLGRLVAQVFLLVLARVWVKRAYPWLFNVKLLLALIPPVAVTIFAQPTAFVTGLVSSLEWIPAEYRPIIGVGLLLVVNLLIFTLIALVCLRIIRPLDVEDAALLNQTPLWLRRALLPFAALSRDKRAKA